MIESQEQKLKMMDSHFPQDSQIWDPYWLPKDRDKLKVKDVISMSVKSLPFTIYPW